MNVEVATSLLMSPALPRTSRPGPGQVGIMRVDETDCVSCANSKKSVSDTVINCKTSSERQRNGEAIGHMGRRIVFSSCGVVCVEAYEEAGS